MGRAEEALSNIETAIRVSPADPLLANWHCWAGMAALHIGKSEAALQWLLNARNVDGTFYHFAVPWLAVAYAEAGRGDEGRALMIEHPARRPGLTMWALNQDFPRRNPTVAKQRERIATVLRRLGMPEGNVQTGSVQ